MTSIDFNRRRHATARARSAGSLVALVFVLAAFAPAAATAKNDKLAQDLDDVVVAGGSATNSVWVNTASGTTLIKAVVVSNTTDPEMTALRAAILASGGSVFARYYAVTALSVMLPLNQVAHIAARADVTSISPNR